MATKLRAARGDDLLALLVEMSSSEVFPRVAESVESDRWHMVSRIRKLPVYARVPVHLPEHTRLVVALLHEALSGETTVDDVPFRMELKAVADVIQSLDEFCSDVECTSCTSTSSHKPRIAAPL